LQAALRLVEGHLRSPTLLYHECGHDLEVHTKIRRILHRDIQFQVNEPRSLEWDSDALRADVTLIYNV